MSATAIVNSSCGVYRVSHRVLPCTTYAMHYVCHVFRVHAVRMLCITHYIIAYVIIHVCRVLRDAICYIYQVLRMKFHVSGITYIII